MELRLRQRSRFAWIQFIWAFALLVWVLSGRSVLAHGGGRTLQVDDIATGAFRLSVWTSPEIRRVGEIHIEMLVRDATGRVDTNCLVWVRVTPLDATGEAMGPGWAVPAPPAPDQPEMEAVIRLDQPGRYAVEVEVTDARGATGRVEFQTEVIQVPGAVRMLILAQVAIACAAGAWLLSVSKGAWINIQDDYQEWNAG